MVLLYLTVMVSPLLVTKRTNRFVRDQPLSNQKPAVRVKANVRFLLLMMKMTKVNLSHTLMLDLAPVLHCSETNPIHFEPVVIVHLPGCIGRLRVES